MHLDLQRHLALVADTLKRGDFARAVGYAEEILRQAPTHVEAKRLLCAGLRGCGHTDRAFRLLAELAAQEPDNALVQNSLGASLREAGDLEGAGKAFQRACQLAPDLAPAWYNLAVVLLMCDELTQALAAIETAVALAPENESIRILRADMLREQGRLDFVTAEYRRMVARDPLSPWGWFGLARRAQAKCSVDELKQMQEALAFHRAMGRERIVLLFALAKAYEDHARYEEASAVLTEANAGMRKTLPWDAASFSRETQRIVASFSSTGRDSAPRQGAEVIFVVSLPRSGSTLTEQILASHPLVEGAGERDELQRVMREESWRRGVAFPDWVGSAAAGDWERMGKQYLELTARWRKARPRFVDKMPDNWRWVGAALSMLPEARVVVCRRDPLETAFSCYRQLFAGGGHAYSYDPQDIASYWRDFDLACRAWRQLHPDRVFDMVYEDLLQDQEAQTRRLLAFCGLDFEPACLRFFETVRNVATISAAQVREPLRRDTARAATYGVLLDPLRSALLQVGAPLNPTLAADHFREA